MAYRVFRFAPNKYKTKNLVVLNSVMFIGEPGGCNRSRVSNRSRGLLLEEIRYISIDDAARNGELIRLAQRDGERDCIHYAPTAAIKFCDFFVESNLSDRYSFRAKIY